jgi:YVTN family beta-propeller protein
MQHFPPTARQVSLAAAVLCLLSLCAGSALAQSVVATIPLPVTPGNVAVNPATELAYVPLTGVGQIDVISERTHAVVGTLSVGEDPVSVAINIHTNRLYVADPFAGDLFVVDANTGAVIATIAMPAYEVALNVATNTIYVGDFNNTIYVVNGDTNTVTTTITVNSAQFMAVNPATNRIYVAPGNPFEGQVTVVDGSTNQVVTNIDIPGSNTTEFVAVDPVRNLVYASDLASDTSSNSGAVAVINGATNTVVTSITVPGEPAGIAVDPRTRDIYVSNNSLSEVQIINGVANRLIGKTVPTGADPTYAVLDFYHGLLYTSNTGDEGQEVANPMGPSVTVIRTR